jgi:CHAT domain-containing protein
MIYLHRFRLVPRLCLLLIVASAWTFGQQQIPEPSQDYVPPEFQASDPEVRAYLDAAEEAVREGNYAGSFQQLQKALDLCTRKGLVADKALIEARLGAAFFLQGKLDDAKQQWVRSLSDSVSTSNLVLQADVLAEVSRLAQATENLTEALDLSTRALDLARKSKNLFMQSRCLGELGHLQLTLGKRDEARASVDEALRIDRLNRYKWEATHLFYLAQIFASDPSDASQFNQAIQLANSARELATKRQDYLTFIRASAWLGNLYVGKGRVDDGIAILERSRDGLSADRKPLFQRPTSYRAAMSEPFPKFVFLKSLAGAYQAGHRPKDALRAWEELYNAATTADFTLFTAGAAQGIAECYQAKKDFTKAISYFSIAAELWAKGGSTQRQIAVLTTEATLLAQQGQGDRALPIREELLTLTKSTKNVALQFLENLSIAEILEPKGDLDRTAQALKDAESLLPSDMAIPGLEPKSVLELYRRKSDLADQRGDQLQAIIAMEKAMFPAAMAKNVDAMTSLEHQLEKRLGDFDLRGKAAKAYESGDLANALIYYELLENFERTHATSNGTSDEYTKHVSETASTLLNLPMKLIAQADGAQILETNLDEMGPIGQGAKLSILAALSDYYILKQRPEMVTRFASAALPYLKLGEQDQPDSREVRLSCNLAYSLMTQGSLDGAEEKIGLCLRSAKRLEEPKNLARAHQINVWVLRAAGKTSEAQESERFLLQHSPEDPQHYVELAQLQTQQGNSSEAIESWQRALQLFEAKKDLKGLAPTHLFLGNAISSKGSNSDAREHLEQALTLYRQLGDGEGEVRASMFLAEFHSNSKEFKKAQEYLEDALKLSREIKRADLEAGVLSEAGRVQMASGASASALEYYKSSAVIYDNIKDLSDEALQLNGEVGVLQNLHKPEEAFEVALKAERLADTSGSSVARCWTRRTLAWRYVDRNEFESALALLREARTISDSTHQLLNSAWASLDLAGVLEDVGAWQEALEAINLSLPIFRQFRDTVSETSAYADLVYMYFSRGSELRDLDKALEYDETAYRMAKTNYPWQAAWLALQASNIYFEQKRFKEAIAKANEAVDYYVRTKDDLDQGKALLSLVNAQGSDDDVHDAAISLARAEQLVTSVPSLFTTGRFYYVRANLLKKEGKFTDAIEQYQRVIAMLEEIKSSDDLLITRKASENYEFMYDDLIDTYYLLSNEGKQNKLAEADRALRYSELNKSRIFTNSWGRTFVDVLKLRLPAELQQREQSLSARQDALKAELAQSISGQGHKAEKEVREELSSLANEKSVLGKELRHANPAYAEARYPEPVAISDLPLHPGETLIEFKMLEDALLVWIVSGSQDGTNLAAFYKVDHPRQWFEERILEIRKAFNRNQPDEFDPQIAEQLFNGLFPVPFAQYVTAAKSIIFVPDDILFLLPFEVLSPNASKSQYVLLETPTSYFPSAAAFRLSRAMLRNKREWRAQFIGIADPVISKDDERYVPDSILSKIEPLTPQSTEKQTQPLVRSQQSVDSLKTRGYIFGRLPNTATEVRNIAALFPSAAITRTGVDARKQELLQTDLGTFRFVHFATHGFFPVEPGIREPALVLSYDGDKDEDERMMLSLSEVLQLKLHAEMVVLSACNTGSGKVTRAEGVASLGTAFLAAGASSVTVSLWNVDDKSTSILMQDLYRNLLNGMPKNAALAAARSALVSKGYSNPFYWAPFVLTGE